MTSNVDINRSVQFVSLDTHPANNALVVTYEILVRASERTSGRELARGNKRHQIQVQLSALDRISMVELQAERMTLSLLDLSEQIRRECPLLANQSLEEIQLHLLYLLNRRRARLAEGAAEGGAEQQVSVNSAPPAAPGRRNRPASRTRQPSSNLRLSAGSERNTTTRQNRFLAREQDEQFAADYPDVYTHLMALETQEAGAQQVCELAAHREDARLDLFLERLDERLSDFPEEQEDEEKLLLSPHPVLEQIESLLSGLYGDQSERLSSIVTIRRLSREQDALLALSSNRMLICAILRSLRDSQVGATGARSRDSILYCLIRFTMFQDIFERCFHHQADHNTEGTSSTSNKDQGGSLSLTLAEIVIDLLVTTLEQQATTTAKTSSIGNDESTNQHYEIITCSLIIIKNLLRHERSNKSRVQLLHLLVLDGHPLAKSASFAKSLAQLLSWTCCRLKRSVKLLVGAPVALLYPLRLTLELMQQLLVFSEFTTQLRVLDSCKTNSVPFPQVWDSLLELLDAIQTSRPSTGMDASLAIKNKRIANDLYELELNLLRLLNNLMLNRRIKFQLIRRNLLKIVLRSLVVFLASNNSVFTFNRSSVLLVPLKSLYELTRHPKARAKIFQSRIVIKCLLEYLQATQQSDFDHLTWQESRSSKKCSLIHDSEQGQLLLLDATCASDYIVCLWINLSARPEAPIYTAEDVELSDLLYEYLDSSFKKLNDIIGSPHDRLQFVYLHLKLIRNITQFLIKNLSLSTSLSSKWVEMLSIVALRVLNDNYHSPSLVELLGSLGNLLLLRVKQAEQESQPEPEAGLIPLMSDLLKLLDENQSSHGRVSLDTDQDDLLLVSLLVVGNMAQTREVCPQVERGGALVARLIEASGSLLSSRARDAELILGTLYTLSQLMGHLSFLRELTREQLTWELSCGQLGGELANLTSHPSEWVSRLSIRLLSCLAQLEVLRDQSGERIKRIRFVAYNGKWMSAIRGSSSSYASQQRLLEGSSSGASQRFLPTGDSREELEDELWDADECEQVVGLIDEQEEDSLNEQENSHQLSDRSQEGATDLSRRAILTGCIDEKDEHEDDDDDDQIDDEDDELPADLNVIDANSMIKHLTSRREFRAATATSGVKS